MNAPSNPQSMSDFPLNQFSRLLANLALEPMRQILVEAHSELMNEFNGGAEERARQMIERNRRG